MKAEKPEAGKSENQIFNIKEAAIGFTQNDGFSGMTASPK
jgi:hypothetical protein